jgi:hypothetical protein
MSSYCNVQTEFKNQSALIAALMETGNWTKNQIEVHTDPKNLIGYQGDVRADKAHIIIRREFVGSASNDLGFVKTENGNYTAIISSYDSSRYNKAWLNNLKGNYAYHTIKEQQEARGRIVSREKLAGNKQRLHIKGYR